MGQQKLNDLMLLHIRKQRTDHIDLKTVVILTVLKWEKPGKGHVGRRE